MKILRAFTWISSWYEGGGVGLADQKDCFGYDIYNTRHTFCHLSRHALPNVDSRITNLQRNANTYTRSGEKINKLTDLNGFRAALSRRISVWMYQYSFAGRPINSNLGLRFNLCFFDDFLCSLQGLHSIINLFTSKTLNWFCLSRFTYLNSNFELISRLSLPNFEQPGPGVWLKYQKGGWERCSIGFSPLCKWLTSLVVMQLFPTQRTSAKAIPDCGSGEV